jgi:hypothetical protein
MKKFLLIFPLTIFLIEFISAHCPLCTVGAGAAAGAAVWLGVSKVVVALFIGAFAMSMGMWFARVLDKKKRYIPFQYSIIVISVFLLTVWPLIPIVKAIGPLYLSFIGEYGKTYAINYSLVSSLLGGGIVLTTPKISRKITKLRDGKMLPFQGILITFLLLIITGGFIQLLI